MERYWNGMGAEFRKHFGPVFRFEVIYRLTAVLIVVPLFGAFIRAVTWAVGYQYLTFTLIFQNWKQPVTWLFLLTGLLVISIIIMPEIIISMIIIFRKDPKADFSYRNLLQVTIYMMKRCFQPKNLLIFPLALFMGVFTFFQTAALQKLTIPGFITEAIYESFGLTLCYLLAKLVLLWLTVQAVFVFHAFFVLEMSFFEALKESIRRVRGHVMQLFLRILLLYGIFLAIYGLLSWSSIALTSLMMQLQLKRLVMMSLTYGLLKSYLLIVGFLRLVLSVTMVRILIAVSFKQFGYFPEKLPWRNAIERVERKVRYATWRHLAYMVCGLVIINAVYANLVLRFDDRSSIRTHTLITAHRAAGKDGPENTLYGLRIGRENQADMAEVDVQLTKDNHLILLHDKTFKRVAGVNKRPQDMTIEEIEKLRIRNKDNFPIRPPTLEETIDIARYEGVQLNIEVKTTRYRAREVAQRVAEIIKRKKYEEECVVTSLDYSVLEEVKKIDPKIKTGYVVVFFSGNIKKLKAADFICLEENSVTENLVEKIHNAGKEVYVWTVNDEATMDKMLEYEVDNIITDRPHLLSLRRVIFEDTNPLMRRLLH